MEKKRVKPQVINGDWEIKKHKIKKELKEFGKKAKPVIIEGGKMLLLGTGIGFAVIIGDKFS